MSVATLVAGARHGSSYPVLTRCVEADDSLRRYIAGSGRSQPGKTVPSCRLPRSGCAALGRDEVASLVEPAALLACSSGKLIGVPGGGGAGNPARGLLANFHRGRRRAPAEDSYQASRCARGPRALSCARQFRWASSDDQHDPASVSSADRRDVPGPCPPPHGSREGLRYSVRISRVEPLCSSPKLAAVLPPISVFGKSSTSRLGFVTTVTLWTAAHVCAQRDFHPQIVSAVSRHNPQTLHDRCARRRALCTTHDTSSSKTPHCLLAHISQDFALLSDAGSIRPTRLVRCDGIGSSSGCCTRSHLRRGGSSRSGSCHGNWCMKRPSSRRHWCGKRSKLLPRCRGWLGTRCG